MTIMEGKDARGSRPGLRVLAAMAAALVLGAALLAASLTRGPGLFPPERRSGSSALEKGGRVAVVVEVYEYAFAPDRVRIRPGRLVAWRAVGEELHNIVPDAGPGQAGFQRARDLGVSGYLFRRRGVYRYHCSLHPRMRGTVVVG